MKKKKQQTTNAMRILDKAGIAYEEREYDAGGEIGDNFGMRIAELTGLSAQVSFKTLAARVKSGIIVACIPVDRELDLKKLAAVSGEKRAELIHVRELPELTGYIRGGVSPIGMKKKYPTYIHESALLHDRIAVSGGVGGVTLLLKPEDLKAVCSAVTAYIVKDDI